jgi:hypothetical protein
VSSLGDLDIVTGAGPADCPAAVSTRRPYDRRGPWLRTGPKDVKTARPAGQPGHGRTAFLRRQPARIVDGRFEGGHNDVYEFTCPGCGDHPYLDYCEVSPRLQWLRGPHMLGKSHRAFDEMHCSSPWIKTSHRSPI